MINAIKIFGFTVVVAAFYTYVGHMVPQKETYPPEETQLSANLTTEEMVEIGQEIVGGKGTCLTCHTIGSEGALRFPDLGNIGAVAGTRKAGYSDVDYLAESLYEPNAYIVEGFQPGMPPIARPPINLNDQEILAVIAYLQSLGGAPSVTMKTELKYQGQNAAATPSSNATADNQSASATGPADGETLFATYLCNTCHTLDSPDRLVGPSLHDVGSRMTKAQIYESIMEPDATIAEGFPAGLMGATLSGVGFYDKISSAELKALVDYLASHEGQ